MENLGKSRPWATAFLSPPQRPLMCCRERGWRERKKERARGPRWEREREKRGLGLGQALSIFRLLLFSLGNPAGTYAEERVRILGA